VKKIIALNSPKSMMKITNELKSTKKTEDKLITGRENSNSLV